MLRTWTRKEALLKAEGRGPAVAPDLVRLGGDPPAPLGWAATARPPAVQLVDLDLGPGQFAALALLSAAPPVIELRRGMSAGRAGRAPGRDVLESQI